jgi:hypothetical protein
MKTLRKSVVNKKHRIHIDNLDDADETELLQCIERLSMLIGTAYGFGSTEDKDAISSTKIVEFFQRMKEHPEQI